jgi:hypothetical protein
VKPKYIVPILIGLAVLALLNTTAQVKSEPKTTASRHHEVVILETGRLWIQNPDGSYGYNGIAVMNASSSAGAPKFNLPRYPDGTNATAAAEAMAQLLDSGYSVEKESVDQFGVTTIRYVK